MAFVITSLCIDIKDRMCVEQCPVECIYEGDRMLYIDANECIDCGACVPACPQGAIFRDDDLSEEQMEYAVINREFVAAVCAVELEPGEAYPDHPHVAAAPSRHSA